MVSGSATTRVRARNHTIESTVRAAIWRALAKVVDPEIPNVSIVELGIVRDVACTSDGWAVIVTPTYSGCPATRIIESDIRAALASIDDRVRIVTALAPAWTTDWIAPEGRQKLRDAGIAPPHSTTLERSLNAQPIGFDRPRPAVRCPNCGSLKTVELARFGSTACKAQYRCGDCLEPFDLFKAH